MSTRQPTAALHHDQSFGHFPHFVATILSFGLWLPVWLARWQMHRTDRVREAVWELSQQVARLEARR